MEKIFLGYVSIALGALGYVLYYRGIFRKDGPRTRPHIFTWLSWTIAVGFAFFASLKSGGGPGVWATGFTAINCAIVTVIALFRGEKHIVWTDWLCFFGSLAGIIYYQFTNGFVVPVIIISLADVIAYIPTYRKVFLKPDEDTASAFALNSLKFAVALVALNSYNVATVFYPATLMLDNGLCAAIILLRRKYLRNHK